MIAGLDGLRFQHWQAELRPDGALVLSLDRADASVNALSQEVLFELGEIVERLGIDPPKAVVFRSAKGNGFIAGADIREFQQFDAKGSVGDAIFRGQQVFQRIAELPCPTAAAIHGARARGRTLRPSAISLASDTRAAHQRATEQRASTAEEHGGEAPDPCARGARDAIHRRREYQDPRG